MCKNALWTVLVMVGMLTFWSSCSTTKYVPDGEYLLNRVRVQSDSVYRDINSTNLRNYVRQMPNARWFSVVKLPLYTYSLSGQDTTRWLNRTLRSLGEAPVLYDSVQALRTCDDLTLELQNEGYLHASVSAATHLKGKKANVTYLLHPGEPFFLRSVRYQIQDSVIARLLTERGDSSKRLLHEGMKFDVGKLDAERKRITAILTNSGYFRFHKEYISYQVDTTRGSRLVDICLRLSPFRRNDKPDTLHSCYIVRSVNYASGEPSDPRLHLRRHVLHENTYIEEGKPYSASGLQNTYNHFGRLQAVKYTNINFSQVPDTALLDCDILLQSNKPSTISFQPEGTNTAGDLGAAASLTYQNRNLFRGSEMLSMEVRGAFEAIRGLEGYSNQDYVEWSAETRLSFPRFIAPFLSSQVRRRMNATSEVSLLYDLQNRPEFHRRVLSAAWRYKWSSVSRNNRYQLDLLDLNYVFMPWISSTFRKQYLDDENSRNAILRYNYEDLFITKIGFGYIYNNGITAVKTNVETSGNLLSMGARLFHGDMDSDGQYRLFKIAFAQYVKADVEVTHSLMIDRNNQLVLHAGVGIAYPYGNSNILPFEKRYFSGGANSVRGWSVRSLGPGSFKEKNGDINFINQTGDMKIDLNMEYRTHLFWKLGGALFVDAGNIWTIRNYEEQQGGQFSFQNFVKQMAVSYGLGFRFNFDYFILRFDMGMKAINPAYEEYDEEHYPLLHPRFSRDFAFHFAVGLPF